MTVAPAAELVDRVRRALADRGAVPTAANVASALRELPGVRSDGETLAVVSALRAEVAGAGPLQPLLADPAVTDVLVQRGGEVWVDRGEGPRRESIRLPGEEAVRRLATRLVATAGRRLDTAQPWADATLPDGHRCHAVLPPLAVDGTCLSLRVLRPGAFDLTALDVAGALPGDLAAWLRAIVRAGLAGLVTGSTGAGKTTLLGALVDEIDPGLRVLVVEDATELAPRHPQVVRLQARPPNVEGVGEVGLRDLVRQALRMRPDRLVLGEVRGAEVVDLLVALNTGHEGGLSTAHANRPSEVPARLEALAALAGMPRDAVHSLAGAALQVIVHCGRAEGRRLVREIAVVDVVDERIVAVPALETVHGRVRRGPGLPSLVGHLVRRGVEVPP